MRRAAGEERGCQAGDDGEERVAVAAVEVEASLQDSRRIARGRGWVAWEVGHTGVEASRALRAESGSHDGEVRVAVKGIEVAAVLPDGRCIAPGRGWRQETIIRESTGDPRFEPASGD